MTTVFPQGQMYLKQQVSIGCCSWNEGKSWLLRGGLLIERSIMTGRAPPCVTESLALVISTAKLLLTGQRAEVRISAILKNFLCWAGKWAAFQITLMPSTQSQNLKRISNHVHLNS